MIELLQVFQLLQVFVLWFQNIKNRASAHMSPNANDKEQVTKTQSASVL